MSPEATLTDILLRIAGVVILYYAGTRGVIVLTRKCAGRWYRRALVSFSFALLFAPSVIGGGGHGSLFPAPAWMAAVDAIDRGRWSDLANWGLVPIAGTWLLCLVVSSLFVMSQNKKNKVDAHAKENR
jgi:hypothetical protein